MDEGKELVVNEQMAKEMGCDLNEITVHDAAKMNKATGMIFVCGDGRLKEIYD